MILPLVTTSAHPHLFGCLFGKALARAGNQLLVRITLCLVLAHSLPENPFVVQNQMRASAYRRTHVDVTIGLGIEFVSLAPSKRLWKILASAGPTTDGTRLLA